nr:RHS repeat-associated core domain-containing protein [Bacteroides nordii]
MLLLPEGYVTFENRFKYTYHYYLRDHLGNNRVVVKQDGETIKQINHYYPFGGSFGEETVISNQPYKFGGKELDKMHGLDWHDFGARYQRNDVPSWIGVDPLCEKYYSISPYAYCMNNPIKYIDPTGMIIEDPENIYLRHKDIINEQLLVIQSNLESGGITDGMRSALKQLEKSYKQVLKEYSALEQSEQVYKIFSADVIGGETYYDKGAVMIGIGDTSLGVVGHELKHAYQYEKGEISIRLDNSKEGTLYDIGDETAAYNRERLFNYGVLFFTNPKEYKWSDSDTRAFGRTINAYMNLQNGPVNINSKVGKQMRNNTIKAWGQRIYPTDAYKGVEMDFRKGQRKSR